MTEPRLVFRLPGHKRTITTTGRKGKNTIYTASCECGWTDAPRMPRDAAKDFHVAHLQDAAAAVPVETKESAAFRTNRARRMPRLGDTWALEPSGAQWVVTAVDPDHYRQRDAALSLRSATDPRVTRRPTIASFLSRYTFIGDGERATCTAKDAMVLGADACDAC